MSFQLSEQARMVQGVVRQWCEKSLAPRIPALEAGEEMPWELMRQFVRSFGLDQMSAAGVKKRIARLREARTDADGARAASGGGADDVTSATGGDPMLMMTVVKELSRVSPGFAMGFGVSLGLAGGALLAKGTAEQLERWALPVVTMEKIASWCLTEPGAGSDAFGSMKTTATSQGTALSTPIFKEPVQPSALMICGSQKERP